jgi:hypothetical protein
VTAGSEVRLEPATLRAGEIYLVLDEPRRPSRSSSAVCRLVHDRRRPTRIAQGDDGAPSRASRSTRTHNVTPHATPPIAAYQGPRWLRNIHGASGREVRDPVGQPPTVPPPMTVLEVLPNRRAGEFISGPATPDDNRGLERRSARVVDPAFGASPCRRAERQKARARGSSGVNGKGNSP